MTCLGYRLVWRSGFAYHRWPPSPDQAVNKYILQLSIVGLVFYEGNGFSLLSRYDYKKRAINTILNLVGEGTLDGTIAKCASNEPTKAAGTLTIVDIIKLYCG